MTATVLALDADLLDGLHASDFVQDSDFGNSLSGSGYQKLPGGLILQWTTRSVSGNARTTVSWPLAFPTACRSAISGYASDLTLSGERGTHVYDLTKTGADLSNNDDTTATVVVWAIGH